MAAMLMATTVSSAQVTTGTGWAYDGSTGKLTISGSEVAWSELAAYKETTKEIVFADDCTFTEIGEEAFQDFSNLTETEITIPAKVTKFGYAAFNRCNITKVNLPSGFKNLGIYGLARTKITKIVLPDGLTSIINYAFFGGALEEIVIPGSAEEIGSQAFSSCPLKKVTIEEGVKKIESSAFAFCSKLTSITLPASLERIDNCAFRKCSNLEEVVILSNGTEDNKHYILLDNADDKDATGYVTYFGGTGIFPTNDNLYLRYNPNTTWVGDDDLKTNLCYYFDADHRIEDTSLTSLRVAPAASAVAEYYDLGGRKVNPDTFRGVVVKVQDGKSVLTTIK